METIEEFETFVRDRVVALHMGLPQKISARKLSYAIGQSAGYINKIETGQSLPSLSGLYYICKYTQRVFRRWTAGPRKTPASHG